MTLYLDPTIPIIAMLGFWLIGGHLVMIPAVNIQSYRCIRRWRVYRTTFLNHASLSSPDSLWAPLLRKKFRRKVFLGRKHSGNDLPLFFLFLLFFVCLRSFFFFSFNFFFLPQIHRTLSLVFPSSPNNYFRYILYLHLCTYVSQLHHTIPFMTNEHAAATTTTTTFSYYLYLFAWTIPTRYDDATWNDLYSISCNPLIQLQLLFVHSVVYLYLIVTCCI